MNYSTEYNRNDSNYYFYLSFLNYNIKTNILDTIIKFNNPESNFFTFNTVASDYNTLFFIDENNLFHYYGGVIPLELLKNENVNNNKNKRNYIDYIKLIEYQNFKVSYGNFINFKKSEIKKLKGFYTYFYIDEKGVICKLKTIEYNKIPNLGYSLSKNLVKVNEEVEFTSILAKKGYKYIWEVAPNVHIETDKPILKYSYKNVLEKFNVKLKIYNENMELVKFENKDCSYYQCCPYYKYNSEYYSNIVVYDTLIGNFDVVQDKNYYQNYYIRNKSVGFIQNTFISISDEDGNYLESNKPFKDNISYRFDKDGIYNISFFVSNGRESQTLERIIIVNNNKKINVFNPKLFYLDKDVSKSLKSIYLDENGINFIKSKNTLELKIDSIYNLFNNYDFKTISYKGVIKDSVNNIMFLQQVDTNKLKKYKGRIPYLTATHIISM